MCDCSQRCIEYAEKTTKKYADCVVKRTKLNKKIRDRNKRKVVDYLGGECAHCGMIAAVVDKVMHVGKATFAPHYAFDVEHVKWEKKKYRISNIIRYSWKRIKKELDDCECILLCRICHAIETQKLYNNEDWVAKKRASHKAAWGDDGKLKSPQPLNSTSA